MLLFSTKLKVLHQGKTLFFATPESAWEWAMETPHKMPNQAPTWGLHKNPVSTPGLIDYPGIGGTRDQRAEEENNHLQWSRRTPLVTLEISQTIGIQGIPLWMLNNSQTLASDKETAVTALNAT